MEYAMKALSGYQVTEIKWKVEMYNIEYFPSYFTKLWEKVFIFLT